MENFDDLFTSVPATPSYHGERELDTEAWIEKKKQERTAVYGMIDEMLASIGSDGAAFQTYLDVQAQFDRYTANNAILVAAQMPEATRLLDFESWKSEGLHILQGEEAIKILEPGKEYERDDGTIGVSYNVKRVFDVSQTNCRKKKEPAVNRDDRLLLKALMNNAPCRMTICETMPENMNAVYDRENNTVLIRPELDATTLFRGLAQEMARAFVEKEHPDCINPAFSAYCVSYILCKRNGVTVDGFSFDQLPGEFAELEPQEVRGQLDVIRKISGDISADMYRAFAVQDKDQKHRGDGGAR